MRTAITIAAMSLVFLAAPASQGTEVYWTPAHELAPQEWSSPVTAGDLDADGLTDLSMLGSNPVRHF